MADWTTCPSCGLKHRQDQGGTCLRCGAPLNTAAHSAPAPPPADSTGRPTRLDFGYGLSFFFRDPQWVSKLAVLSLVSLLSCVLVGLPLVQGYFFRLRQRSARADEPVLPPWEDFGGLFVDGLRMMFLPVLALWPLVILLLAALIANAAVNGDRDPKDGFGLLVQLIWVFSVLGSSLVALVYMPAVRARVATTNRVATAFELRANLAFIRRNAANYVLSILLFVAANMIANFGWLLCCVGAIPTTLWAMSVLSWGEGQVALLDATGTSESEALAVFS
jgi:Protein of unknown function (DUF4013)